MSLSETEARVLEYLCQDTDCAWPFWPICRDLKMPRPDVRAACRSLKSQGLAIFWNGLINEDGGFVGSGYGASPEGVHEFNYRVERAE